QHPLSKARFDNGVLHLAAERRQEIARGVSPPLYTFRRDATASRSCNYTLQRRRTVMDDFGREALRRLPLAEAALRIWAYITDERFLAGLFERHRGRCYERLLHFSVIVAFF